MARNLRATPGGGRTLAVCGILTDKDASGVAAELRDCVDAWWCVPTEGERGRSGADLARAIESQVAVPVAAAESIAAGCSAALALANPGIESLHLARFTPSGPYLTGSRRTAAATGGASRIYCGAPSHFRLRRTAMDRRVKERLVGASILVVLIVLIVPELLSGPAPGPVAPRLPVSAPEPVRNVTVDLATSKAPATEPVVEAAAETPSAKPPTDPGSDTASAAAQAPPAASTQLETAAPPPHIGRDGGETGRVG